MGISLSGFKCLESIVKSAICIGNGNSRKSFDLNKIKNVGPTYGCNQLIEDFILDNTIVVDRPLLLDLVSKGYHEKTNLYTREKWHNLSPNLKKLSFPDIHKNHRWDNEQHWGSGVHALNLAATHNPDIIIMLGYDLWAPNVYSAKTIDPACWIYQISRLLDIYPNISFVQIQPKEWKCPEMWDKDNMSFDSYDKLEELIPVLSQY